MFSTQYVLIMDSKGDESHFIEGILENDSYIKLLVAKNFAEASENIKKYEPDLILVHDNFNQDVSKICEQIRAESGFYRPVIIVLSANEDIDKKVEILKAGADDYHNESIDHKELSLRIFANLRRHVEELTDPLTKLPSTNLSYRVLKRVIESKSENNYSLMYLDIDNFNPYREAYGHIASEKLLQTFVAIIKTALNEDDFLGRIGNDSFVLLTSPEKAEKIAVFLCYSFDMVSQKFYTNEDVERGYLILDGDEKIGRRIPFVAVSVGIISNRYKNFASFEDLMNSVMNVHRLSKSRSGSYWISDRPKIQRTDLEVDDPKKKILIVENDAALSYLLITTLEMQGYNAESINSSEHTIDMIEKINPALVVFDTSNENAEKELEICRTIKQNYSNIKVIVSTVDCNKEKVLDAGVDLYIPKPYELMVLFSWISRFLNYEVLQ